MTGLELVTHLVGQAGDIDPCIEWPRYRATNGFGKLSIKDVSLYAHRVAYSVAHGAVPEGCKVYQTCRNKGCINPAHLVADTHAEMLKAVRAPYHREPKSHCIHGHEYTEANTAITNGKRRCRACTKENSRKWKARQRGERDG